MGKHQQSGRKSKAKYTHVTGHNPKARESEERRIEKLHQLSVKRLSNLVEKQKDKLKAYYAEGKRRKATAVDPSYQLKGAARVAREFYPDPNFKPADESEDILELYKGRLYEHQEGQVLLQHMMDMGVYYHNKMERTGDAVKVFEEMMKLDTKDRMCARHSLLRCHLDNADAVHARNVITKYSPIDGDSVVFHCTSVFIEILSHQLEEKGSSIPVIHGAIDKMHQSNPFILWILTFNHLFEELDELIDTLISCNVTFRQDSLEEALRYYRLDLPLWTEDESTIDYLADYIKDKRPLLMPSKIGMDNGRIEQDGTEHAASSSSSSSAATATATAAASGDDGASDSEDAEEGEEDEEEEEQHGAAAAAAPTSAAGSAAEAVSEPETLNEDQISEVVATCRSMYNTSVGIIRRELKKFHKK